MIEPDPALHHIFSTIDDAQAFYDRLILDESLSEEQRADIKPPRQAIGDRWIVDKVN